MEGWLNSRGPLVASLAPHVIDCWMARHGSDSHSPLGLAQLDSSVLVWDFWNDGTTGLDWINYCRHFRERGNCFLEYCQLILRI